jgi:hypothetical protein
MDPGGTAWGYMIDSDFPRDITVLKADSFVMFENGTLADASTGIYNHHQIFVDMNKKVPRMASCEGQRFEQVPSGMPFTVFMGTAEDKSDVMYSTPDGMFNSGFYINKTDTLYFGGDFVNYNKELRTVYTVADMEYLEGRPKNLLETGLNVISVGMCDGLSTMSQQFSGRKRFSLKGREMVINSNGYIVAGSEFVHLIYGTR